MAILVTGAAGFIGYSVCHRLLARGERVIGLDNLNPYYSVTLKQHRIEELERDHGRAFEFVKVDFAESGVRRVAEIAFHVNERTENIGARRLHTVMERLLETVSYDATEQNGSSVTVDAKYVDDHLGNLVKDEDLSRYIL